MTTRSSRLLSRLPLAGLALLIGLLSAQTADAVYLFYMRKDLKLALEKNPASVMDKQVVFTDELTVVWPEAQERKSDLGGSVVLFSTTHFNCAVPSGKMGTHLESIADDAMKGYSKVTEKIEAVNEQERLRELSADQARAERRKLYWELYRIWSNKPLVTVFGTVKQADLWGEVRGKSQGVATEAVTIVADRVEKPRRRWYESLDD